MSREQNQALIRRLFDEVVNRRDLTVLDEIIAPSFIVDDSGEGVPGPAGMKQLVQWLVGVFPDLRYTIEDILAAEDRVAVRLRAYGTQHGAYLGHPPSGKKVSYDEMMFFRLVDQRITEWHVVVDSLGILQQIGALSPPGEPSS